MLGRAKFHNDKLTLVYVTSTEVKDPSPILELLSDRFGKPTTTRVGKATNAFGAVFTQPTYFWQFKDKSTLTFIHNYERVNNIGIIFDPNNGDVPKRRPSSNPF